MKQRSRTTLNIDLTFILKVVDHYVVTCREENSLIVQVMEVAFHISLQTENVPEWLSLNNIYFVFN